jgi:MraZ protein
LDKDPTVFEEDIKGLRGYVGGYVYALDAKKRLTLPSTWRAQIAGSRSVYVLPNPHERCLNVYPAKEFDARIEPIRQRPLFDKRAQDLRRTVGALSDLLSWDAQGRIRVSDRLLGFAAIESDVLVLGALDGLELWNPAMAPAGLGGAKDPDPQQMQKALAAVVADLGL